MPISKISWLPFMFSNIMLSDDDDLLDRSTGNIEIHVEISKCHVEKKRMKGTLVYYRPQEQRQVHERGKKGLTGHEVGFAAAVANRAMKCSKYRCTAIGSPVVIFILNIDR
ncbi:hypothetical protein F5146DRAFT_1034179 [Armillaria mellea]|nr:hypothetical protein F5146DRAFT_1034179 [Armillaria mellea]